jgi:chromosome segregation ATPase
MAELETAGKRFDEALTRLESALTKWSESGSQSAAEWTSERNQMQAELGALKEDYARVNAECTGLRQRNEALGQATNSVSSKLDATIGELTELLEA